MGLSEFFAMEAADYLERLDALVSKGPLDHGEFTRLARALRGSALMANQQPLAAVAAGFEQLARAVREGRRSWDAATQQVALRAVDDFKRLVRRLSEWGPEEAELARRMVADLETAAGGVAEAAPAPAASADAKARALIAQQSAALGSTLERAAQAVQADPKAHGALTAVLQLIQPLRGLASIADYPPLPDLLDAVERTIGEVRRQPHPVGDLASALRTAALALARAAREIAGDGRADPDAPELAELVEQLAVVLGLDPSVVAIERLYFDDAGPHVVEPGVAPASASPPGPAELLAHGEYLRQAADGIESARSAPERELRAQGLIGTFRTLAGGGDGPLAAATAAFARVGSEALAHRWASTRTADVLHFLRGASEALSAAGRLEDPTVAARLNTVTAALAEAARAAPKPAGVAPAAPAPLPPPTVARPSAPPVVPELTEALEPGLAGSYRHYERLVTALGLVNPSIDVLVAGPPALPAVAPTPATPAAEAKPAEGAVVPIEELVYSGAAALERALSLRGDVRQALATASPDAETVRELIEEIFDLVELSRAHRA